MSIYALQTKTMLKSVSNSPLQLLGAANTRDEPKQQLPSKRKRDAICGLGSFTKPFTIKPCPESPYDKPATFKPVRIIGRSQLPLTFLDTTTDDSLAANSLFSAHIELLENDAELGAEQTRVSRVLIARYETKRTLYAIERVQVRVYSIRRLAAWLKEKDVSELWDPSSLQAYPVAAHSKITSGMEEWWQHAAVETQAEERPMKRARMSMLRRKPEAHQVEETTSQRFDSPMVCEAQGASHVAVTAPQEQAQLPISTQDQLESLVHQYLDAVYLSKTSLAYFAKGPVTRIRNAFTSSEEGAPPTHELVTFLRTMLISPKASEKKYYEKLPALIKALPPGNFSDEETVAAPTKTRKSKKKLKLSREGVYPHEDSLVKKWWLSDMPSSADRGEESVDQRIKRRIGDLRVRETLAQLTLMLEIIGLEALSTYKPPPEHEAPGDGDQAEEQSQAKPTKCRRKLDDIGLQLDLLLDRLCIWHATDEAGILDFDAKPTQQYDDADNGSKGGVSDRLRSYCIEVVIPFYMNRLPEQALMINKKLGGPAHTSPPKRKAMNEPTTSRKSGEPKEPEAKKSRRSLARVATDNMRRTVERVTPSLSRSATDSALIKGIKREGSEVPLSAIPFQRSPSKSSRRSMSQLRHLEGREMDLSTPSAAMTAKLKQKQRVEEELKEAIAALKKPNRGLAAGAYVQDNERRSLGPTGRPRKQLHPTRKVTKDVQVSATPRVGSRTKDVIEQTPSRHYQTGNPFARFTTAAAPLSSELCIPSSGGRLSSSSIVPGTIVRSATARQLGHSSVAETPSKGPSARALDSGPARRTIFATPSKPVPTSSEKDFPTASLVLESPAKVIGSSLPTMANVPQAQAAVVATPVKMMHSSAIDARMPAFPQSVREGGDSIYAALGWDDDDAI